MTRIPHPERTRANAAAILIIAAALWLAGILMK
jgi:hypothetical protein